MPWKRFKRLKRGFKPGGCGGRFLEFSCFLVFQGVLNYHLILVKDFEPFGLFSFCLFFCFLGGLGGLWGMVCLLVGFCFFSWGLGAGVGFGICFVWFWGSAVVFFVCRGLVLVTQDKGMLWVIV